VILLSLSLLCFRCIGSGQPVSGIVHTGAVCWSTVHQTGLCVGMCIRLVCVCLCVVRRVGSGQSGAGGADTGAGKQRADGVLCVSVRGRHRQVWPAACTAQRTAACQPLRRGIPLHVWNYLQQHAAHGDAPLTANITRHHDHCTERTLAK